MSAFCGRGYGCLYHPGRQVAVAAACRKWDCPHCRQRKAKSLRALLKQIQWGSFLTITMAPNYGAPTVANLCRQARALKHWFQWVRRYIGHAFGERALDRFYYAWVREVGERAQRRLHLHLLWTAPYIAQAELAAAAVRCGLGQRLDIRAVKSQQQVGEYASKVSHYLTKEQQQNLPRGARHYGLSAPVVRPGKDPDWAFSVLSVHSVVWWVFGVKLERRPAQSLYWTLTGGLTWSDSS